MPFKPEPPFRHGSTPSVGVLVVNLGTPEAPTAPALRKYLAQFLSDPRVVEIPKLLWWPILHGIILRTRPAKSAAKYATVWTPEGSPLGVWTERQSVLLGAALAARGHRVQVLPAMRYGEPSIASALDRLRAGGATRVLVLPMYPQYAAATTASVGDAVGQWAAQTRRVPEMRSVGEYHDDPGYIAALAARVRAHWQAHGRGEKLVLSFHGVPHRSLLLGDPYHCQCHKTARLLGRELELAEGELVVTFQSRFGKARWLEPYTEPTLRTLAASGVKRVDVMCPGFVADCLETLEEIDDEARDAFLAAGGERFGYIACLNDAPDWIEALARIAETHLQGWPTRAAAPADRPAAAAPPASGASAPAIADEDRAVQRERALAMGAAD